VGLSKAQQRYWVLADGLAVVGRRRSARELACRTNFFSNPRGFTALPSVFVCERFNCMGSGREGRPKSRTEIRMSRVYVRVIRVFPGSRRALNEGGRSAGGHPRCF
jgi:hypothetical protein